MPEGGVDNAVRPGCSRTQAFQVIKIASLRLSAGSSKRFGTRIRTRQPEDLMACVDQFPDNGRANEACGSCNENSHAILLL
jgi:hypothetical protein